MLGWLNPLPMELGGGPAPTARLYAALRETVGEGGSAVDDQGIEGLWRAAKATALAAASSASERAVLQVFPGRATDHLAYWESLLGVTPAPGATVVQRQADAERALVERVRNAAPDLEARLIDIDARLSLVQLDLDKATVTIPGRAFEDMAGALPFGGGRRSTRVPNYSSAFVLSLLFSIGAGVVPSGADLRALTAAADYLTAVLPAHVTFQIVTSFGFNLDLDLLDLTGLDP